MVLRCWVVDGIADIEKVGGRCLALCNCDVGIIDNFSERLWNNFNPISKLNIII